MPEQTESSGSRGIGFHGRMRLYWTERSETAEVDASNDDNEHLLRALLLCQESPGEVFDESVDRMSEIARVEAKLDLLLDLVSALMGTDASGAVEHPVEIWLNGLAWVSESSEVPGRDQALWLYLYLDPRLPRPLKLPVRVSDLKTQPPAMEISVRFEMLSELLEDLLGRLIFRQHRRTVAKRKAGDRLKS